MSLIYGNFQNMMGLGLQQPAPAMPDFASLQSNQMGMYMQLGQEMVQRQMAAMQQAFQQMQAMQPPTQPDGQSLNLGNNMLASGFDMNWLSQRLAAGSANGASIKGLGGGGGGGEDYVPSEHPEDRIAGSERLKDGFWNKTKDLMGWGANNKFGFGR